MSRRSTILDVARKAGVSKSTVSRVISGDGENVSERAKLRVEQAIRELGYVRDAVASSMRTQRTQNVMLAIPDITNPFWPAVARGVQDAMDQEGYAVVFANSDWNGKREARFLEMVRGNRLDGLLINPIGVTERDLRDLGIPVVILGINSGLQLDMVGTSSKEGAREALTHLLSLGHQRIGLILGIREGRKRGSRLSYYQEIMSTAGLVPNNNLHITVPFRQKGGKEAMIQLLAREPVPTAVFCENDLLAIGAIEAARELGVRVPEEVSVVGMDNIFAASTTMPPLTTVAKPKYDLGVQAARLLLERMQTAESGPPRRVFIGCQLMIRESTAPPGT
jgi:DNA-binding LacI/PurR family transcriptional regulator